MPILPIATETPAAIFQLVSYVEVSDQLCGLTWGAEDLPAAIGAATSREEDGSYTPPYEIVRALTLFAAHAATVLDIEDVYTAINDIEDMGANASRARRDGCTGMMRHTPTKNPLVSTYVT